MPAHPKPSLAATWKSCHRCGTLYTAAHPCTCRVLAHDAEPGPAMALWPVCTLAVLLVAALLALIGWH